MEKNNEERLDPSLQSWVRELDEFPSSFLAATDTDDPSRRAIRINLGPYQQRSRNATHWLKMLETGYDTHYIDFQLRYCRAYAHIMREPPVASGVMPPLTEAGQPVKWVVAVDDDSVVWPRNVVRFLAGLNASEPYFIGYTIANGALNSGAGSIFSAEALRRLAPHLDKCSTLVAERGYPQDVATASAVHDGGMQSTHTGRVYMTQWDEVWDPPERGAFPLVWHHLRSADILNVYEGARVYYNYLDHL
jgi:hypothetical protein